MADFHALDRFSGCCTAEWHQGWLELGLGLDLANATYIVNLFFCYLAPDCNNTSGFYLAFYLAFYLSPDCRIPSVLISYYYVTSELLARPTRSFC